MTPMRSSEEQFVWLRARQIVLARDQHRCRRCHELCEKGEADIHHVIPRSLGGLDEPSNLITLCDGCHGAVHPNQQAILSQGFLRRWALKLALWLDKVGEFPEEVGNLRAALAVLGVREFRGRQLEVVLAALKGQSVLMVSPTGSGKTLCFQVPALLTHGTTIVVAPLKALMADQVSNLQQKQIPATFINSDLGTDEKVVRYGLLKQLAIKFLYVAPERFDLNLVKPGEVGQILSIKPSYLVVDEAHCVDKWGRDFRPSYSRLSAVRRDLNDPPILAFTATATLRTQERILDSLGIPDAKVITTDIDRPNIALLRLRTSNEDERFRIIDDILSMVPLGRTMIFVPTKKIGEKIEVGLAKLGRSVPFFHSKLDANTREKLFGRFQGRLSPPLNTIICTNAFGMGLDIPDVRLVVHWQHPASVEDYLQEFGRAGRDGRQSLAVLFTQDRRDNRTDTGLLEFMAKHSVANVVDADKVRDELLKKKVDDISSLAELCFSEACFRDVIKRLFVPPEVPVQKSLARRLLEWVFLKRERARSSTWCCDACDHISTSNYSDWAKQVLHEGHKSA